MPAFHISLLALVLWATPLCADWTYEVTGAKDDLMYVIVSLPLPEKITVPEAVSVTGPDGVYLSQIMPAGVPGVPPTQTSAIVVLPALKAGKTVTLTVKPQRQSFYDNKLMYQWETENNRPTELWLRGDGRDKRVMSFVGAAFDPSQTPPGKQALENPTIKPYHHVFDPNTGTHQLTNGPFGRYPHHRGVFYGFNKISYHGQQADTWHCRNGESTVAGDPQLATGGPLFGLHRFPVTWNGRDGKPFAQELRQLAVFGVPNWTPGNINVDGTVIDFTSELRTTLENGAKLDGDPQHAGFHFRANSEMEKNTHLTYFLRPDVRGEPGEERNWHPKTKKGPANQPWDAMSFELGHNRFTVLYLDHPNNPKEARQSERCYGRIGTYFEYLLTPQKPLVVHYRLWIAHDEVSKEVCEALSKSFTEDVKVVAK
jgi:hypothetical protein